MKKSRLAVTAALSASVLAGSMLLAAPALAADYYVPDAEKGKEGETYPAGWFTGNPQPEVAPVDDETGITLTGKTQFLYGGNIDMPSGANFSALADSSAVDADGDTYFQYPIFFNAENAGNLGFTTLRPVDAGTPGEGGSWYSSQNVVINNVVILSQGEHTFGEVADAFDAAAEAGATPTVLAVGVFVDTGAEALVRSISFGGDTYFFTEEPEAPVVPTPGTDDDDTAEEAAPVATPVATEATFTG